MPEIQCDGHPHPVGRGRADRGRPDSGYRYVVADALSSGWGEEEKLVIENYVYFSPRLKFLFIYLDCKFATIVYILKLTFITLKHIQ
jgi:hypothetical protein